LGAATTRGCLETNLWDKRTIAGTAAAIYMLSIPNGSPRRYQAVVASPLQTKEDTAARAEPNQGR
jgi:hypothetical protein